MKLNIILFMIFMMTALCGCGRSVTDDRVVELDLAGDPEEDSSDLDAAMDPQSDEGDKEKLRTIIVYICGCVVSPGVYELPEGSRLYELLDRCQGLRDDAAKDVLNLAMPIADGERIYVPSADEVKASLSMEGSYDPAYETGAADDDRININTADETLLQTINGIGASRAADIVAYREANGPFASPEDIMKVSGIKEGLYSKIKDRIRI